MKINKEALKIGLIYLIMFIAACIVFFALGYQYGWIAKECAEPNIINFSNFIK